MYLVFHICARCASSADGNQTHHDVSSSVHFAQSRSVWVQLLFVLASVKVGVLVGSIRHSIEAQSNTRSIRQQLWISYRRAIEVKTVMLWHRLLCYFNVLMCIGLLYCYLSSDNY